LSRTTLLVALHRIVQSLLFVSVERADLAARFANGNWSEIPSVLPLVDKFLNEVANTTTVVYAFLTLCERAFDSYPTERFISQLPLVLYRQTGIPLGWRGSSIPNRLASLIQRFAERSQPLASDMARTMLQALDSLVDMGDRRAAAIQTSEIFKNVRTVSSAQ
jgi:hypothetical protein